MLALLFGEDYRAASSILIPLALGQLVNVGTGLCGLVLTMCGREREALVVAVGTAAMAVGADLVAAKLGGADALAWTSATVTAVLRDALARPDGRSACGPPLVADPSQPPNTGQAAGGGR